jgi:leucyl aminopeptidase
MQPEKLPKVLMEFNVKSGMPQKQRTACVVVGIFEPRRLSAAADELDKASKTYLANILRRGDMDGNLEQTLLLHNVPGSICDRVLLVGCGKEREFGASQYRKAVAAAATTLGKTGAKDAVSYLTDLHVKGHELHWKIRQAVEATAETHYRFDELKTKRDDDLRPLRKMTFNVPSRRELLDGDRAVAEGQAIAAGVSLSKNLGNLPGNVCTPTYLASQAKELAKGRKELKVSVLEQADMEKLQMGALLSVTRGSRQPPKLIVMQYNGAGNDSKPHVLVGKGITFDSGGISLKPGAAMDEMKYDMCGAAGVFGTMRAVSELKLPINVVGVIPTCENLPDGAASKPGDIVTSMSGQTIEILNTDAEGRLILCDALTYVKKFNPEAVIDIATLTGACVVALGNQASGLLSNHNPLAHDLLNAGAAANDRVWKLPLWDEYQEQLKSNFADMANIGGKGAGTITAACFLARFTRKYRWAHLDIAGTAWNSGSDKGATGRPVPLLVQYLLDRCPQAGR